MAKQHQAYCDTKVAPIVEKMVSSLVMERPDKPVPFMVRWLGEHTGKPIQTPAHQLSCELRQLQEEIRDLERRMSSSSMFAPPAAAAPGAGASRSGAAGAAAGWSLVCDPTKDLEMLERQHGAQITDRVAVVVRGWRIAFNCKGIPLAEPAFASVVRGGDDDEVHGLAFRVPAGGAAGRLEESLRSGSEYESAAVSFTTYDGRVLEGSLYTPRARAAIKETAPSARHIRELVAVARRSGLSAGYIDRIAATPAYEASAATLRARDELPSPDSLPEITCDELTAMAAEDDACHVACLGYIVRVPKEKIYVGSHKGRDVTSRLLKQWRGLPLDSSEEAGGPPYPTEADMKPEELEFISNWLDHYLWAGGGASSVVGFVSELRQQRDLEALGVDLALL